MQAIEKAKTRSIAMLGDQLFTDIAGAHNADIDSILVKSGVSHCPNNEIHSSLFPKYILDDFIV